MASIMSTVISSVMSSVMSSAGVLTLFRLASYF